jgi:hypothetical protein
MNQKQEKKGNKSRRRRNNCCLTYHYCDQQEQLGPFTKVTLAADTAGFIIVGHA